MKRLLRLDAFRHRHKCAIRQKLLQQSYEEWLSATADARDRTCAALLQALSEGFHSGSCGGPIKQLQGRTCRTLCQLAQNLAAITPSVKGRVAFNACALSPEYMFISLGYA